MSADPQLPNAATAQALERIGSIMEEALEDWCLIGGAAALLHGIALASLDDIDVLLSPLDAERLLPRNGILPTPDGGTERFRSQIFSRCRLGSIQVDFLAGFEVCVSGRWMRVQPRHESVIKVRGAAVRLPSVDDLIQMHLLFNRPKDVERVNVLRAWSSR